MSGSMADIQYATAEIRRGKKKERKKQDKNIMSASATQGGHKNCANVHAQATAVLLFETRKLIYKTTRIILPRQLTPICPFICGKPTEFATFRELL